MCAILVTFPPSLHHFVSIFDSITSANCDRFQILLGDKLGYYSLPVFIEAGEFLTIRSEASESGKGKLILLSVHVTSRYRPRKLMRLPEEKTKYPLKLRTRTSPICTAFSALICLLLLFVYVCVCARARVCVCVCEFVTVSLSYMLCYALWLPHNFHIE